jgi:hypothetical protein
VGIVRIIVGRGAATFRPSAFQPRLPAHARTRADTISLGARKIKVLFFEKRSKKLLLVGIHGQFRRGLRIQTDKSFLVLFFKKELFCRPELRSAPARASSPA